MFFLFALAYCILPVAAATTAGRTSSVETTAGIGTVAAVVGLTAVTIGKSITEGGYCHIVLRITGGYGSIHRQLIGIVPC